MSRILAAIHSHRIKIPDRCALRDDRGALSWAEVAVAVDQRADRLRAAKTNRLVLRGDNGIDWMLWDLAAISAGVATIPIPPFFSPTQIAHVLALTGPAGMIEGDDLVSFHSNTAVVWPANTAKVPLTSGTTGTPKGVCLSLAALEQVAASLTLVTAPIGLKVHVASLSLAILLENVAGAYVAILAGAELVLPSAPSRGLLGATAFQPKQLLKTLARYRASSVILAPGMLKQILGAIPTQPCPKSLRFVAVGGARVGARLIEQSRALGLPAFEGYGLSECGSVVSLNLPGQDMPGSAGVPLAHAKLRIEDGLVHIHSPGFLGYLGGPGPRSDAWVHSGDEGEFDRGALYLKGRRSHAFITSFGRKLVPEWPESELLAEPEIRLALVFGEARVVPIALLDAPPEISDATLAVAVARANRRLPDYARIGTWQRLPEPPSYTNGLATATGKPRRDRVFARYGYLFDGQLDEETV